MKTKYRPLTYDEKKAAEAAFTGLPFDPQWSEAAKKIYLGISKVMVKNLHEILPELNPYRPTMLMKLALPNPYHQPEVLSPRG